jgi:hypothetical protein
MSDLDEYKCKLVGKILLATSNEQIKRFLLTAIRSLEKNNVHGHIVNRFIDKAVLQLDELKNPEADIRTLMNIKFASSQLALLKRRRS